MNSVLIEGVEFFRHEYFSDYASSTAGEVIRISTGKKPRQRYELYNGEMEYTVFLWHRGFQHRYLKKRLIFEIFNEVKLDNKVKIRCLDSKCHNLSIFNLYIE